MKKNKIQIIPTSKELVLRTETRFYSNTVHTLLTIVKVSTTYKTVRPDIEKKEMFRKGFKIVHPDIEEKEMFRRGFVSMDEAAKGLELATSIVAALGGDSVGK